MRRWFPFLIAVCGGCAGPHPLATREPLATPPSSGLPSVALESLAGAPARLAEVLHGRVGVVSLWATWCEACAGEFDALGRLADRAEARGAKVVAISVGEPRQTVADFVAWRGLKYTQLVDAEFKFADALGVRRVPSTLVIDRAGRVTFAGGALDDAALAALRAALDDATLAHR